MNQQIFIWRLLCARDSRFIWSIFIASTPKIHWVRSKKLTSLLIEKLPLLAFIFTTNQNKLIYHFVPLHAISTKVLREESLGHEYTHQKILSFEFISSNWTQSASAEPLRPDLHPCQGHLSSMRPKLTNLTLESSIFIDYCSGYCLGLNPANIVSLWGIFGDCKQLIIPIRNDPATRCDKD